MGVGVASEVGGREVSLGCIVLFFFFSFSFSSWEKREQAERRKKRHTEEPEPELELLVEAGAVPVLEDEVVDAIVLDIFFCCRTAADNNDKKKD